MATQQPVLVQDDMTIWFATDAARDVAKCTFVSRIDDEQKHGSRVKMREMSGPLGCGITVDGERDEDVDVAIDILMDIAIEYRAQIVECVENEELIVKREPE